MILPNSAASAAASSTSGSNANLAVNVNYKNRANFNRAYRGGRGSGSSRGNQNAQRGRGGSGGRGGWGDGHDLDKQEWEESMATPAVRIEAAKKSMGMGVVPPPPPKITLDPHPPRWEYATPAASSFRSMESSMASSSSVKASQEQISYQQEQSRMMVGGSSSLVTGKLPKPTSSLRSSDDYGQSANMSWGQKRNQPSSTVTSSSFGQGQAQGGFAQQQPQQQQQQQSWGFQQRSGSQFGQQQSGNQFGEQQQQQQSQFGGRQGQQNFQMGGNQRSGSDMQFQSNDRGFQQQGQFQQTQSNFQQQSNAFGGQAGNMSGNFQGGQQQLQQQPGASMQMQQQRNFQSQQSSQQTGHNLQFTGQGNFGADSSTQPFQRPSTSQGGNNFQQQNRFSGDFQDGSYEYQTMQQQQQMQAREIPPKQEETREMLEMKAQLKALSEKLAQTEAKVKEFESVKKRDISPHPQQQQGRHKRMRYNEGEGEYRERRSHDDSRSFDDSRRSYDNGRRSNEGARGARGREEINRHYSEERSSRPSERFSQERARSKEGDLRQILRERPSYRHKSAEQEVQEYYYENDERPRVDAASLTGAFWLNGHFLNERIFDRKIFIHEGTLQFILDESARGLGLPSPRGRPLVVIVVGTRTPQCVRSLVGKLQGLFGREKAVWVVERDDGDVWKGLGVRDPQRVSNEADFVVTNGLIPPAGRVVRSVYCLGLPLLDGRVGEFMDQWCRFLDACLIESGWRERGKILSRVYGTKTMPKQAEEVKSWYESGGGKNRVGRGKFELGFLSESGEKPVAAKPPAKERLGAAASTSAKPAAKESPKTATVTSKTAAAPAKEKVKPAAVAGGSKPAATAAKAAAVTPKAEASTSVTKPAAKTKTKSADSKTEKKDVKTQNVKTPAAKAVTAPPKRVTRSAAKKDPEPAPTEPPKGILKTPEKKEAKDAAASKSVKLKIVDAVTVADVNPTEEELHMIEQHLKKEEEEEEDAEASTSSKRDMTREISVELEDDGLMYDYEEEDCLEFGGERMEFDGEEEDENVLETKKKREIVFDDDAEMTSTTEMETVSAPTEPMANIEEHCKDLVGKHKMVFSGMSSVLPNLKHLNDARYDDYVSDAEEALYKDVEDELKKENSLTIVVYGSDGQRDFTSFVRRFARKFADEKDKFLAVRLSDRPASSLWEVKEAVPTSASVVITNDFVPVSTGDVASVRVVGYGVPHMKLENNKIDRYLSQLSLWPRFLDCCLASAGLSRREEEADATVYFSNRNFVKVEAVVRWCEQNGHRYVGMDGSVRLQELLKIGGMAYSKKVLQMREQQRGGGGRGVRGVRGSRGRPPLLRGPHPPRPYAGARGGGRSRGGGRIMRGSAMMPRGGPRGGGGNRGGGGGGGYFRMRSARRGGRRM